MINIKSEDEQLVDILFCGIKDEPCEKTVDFTSIESAQVFDAVGPGAWYARSGAITLKTEDTQTCDEVCELFGGPPTRKEKFTTWLKFKYFSIKLFLIKYFKLWLWHTRYRTETIGNDFMNYKVIKELRIFGYWVKIKSTIMIYGNTEK